MNGGLKIYLHADHFGSLRGALSKRSLFWFPLDFNRGFSMKVQGLRSVFILVGLISAYAALAPLGDSGLALSLLIIGWLIAAIYYPCQMLAATLFLFPVVGLNRPSMPQTVVFYQLESALLVGLCLRWLMEPRDSTQFKWSLAHPITLFLGLYFAAGVMSLTSLPITEVLEAFSTVSPKWRWLAVGEGSVLYPLLTVVYQLQLFVLFLLIVNFPTTWQGSPKLWVLALAGGLALSVLAGLLDYYGVIDLRLIRPLDPLVNAGGVQFRLQSFAGHSGWYAEYLTMAAPCTLALLLLPIPRKWQMLFIILFLVLVEYALILTYQRGGWLSYPVTVFAIWVSFYLLRQGDAGAETPIRSVRKSLIKVAISIPVTILISLTLIWVFNQTSDEVVKKYTSRLQQITVTRDRTRYIPVALNLASLHPIMGGGNESFCYRYVESYINLQGKFHQEPDPVSGYYGSAHNVYLQTLTGKGVVGLVCLLGLIGSTLWMSVTHMRRRFVVGDAVRPFTYETKILTMLVFAYSVAFLIYGNVQEIFYVPGLNLLLYVLMGIFVAQIPPANGLSKRMIRWGLYLFAMLSLAQLVWEYGYPGETRKALGQALQAKEYSRNCYDVEVRGDQRWQWCGKNSRVKLPLLENEQGELIVHLQVANPDLKERPLTFRYGGLEGPSESVTLTAEKATAEIRIPIASPYLVEHSALDKRPAERFVVLSLDVPRTWVPKDFGINADTRSLGVYVQWPSPSAPVSKKSTEKVERDCYQLEHSGNHYQQWCGKNSLLKLPLAAGEEGKLSLHLHAFNPDLKDYPLTVRYGGLDGYEKTVTLTADQATAEIRIPLTPPYVVEQLSVGQTPGERYALLKLDVSRTWMPKAFGVNEDTRELGVCVFLPESIGSAKLKAGVK